MTPEDFARRIKQYVVEDNLLTYRDLFANTRQNEVSDEYWRRALELFGPLNAAQKEVLFEIIGQVSVDTVSGLLGVLDNASYLGPDMPRLSLKADGTDEELSGELQDEFLRLQEG